MSTAQIVGWGLAAITAAGGLSWVVAAFTVRANKEKILAEAGKTDADAAEVIRKSATAWAAEMQEDAQAYRAEAKATRVEVTRLESKVADLSHQLDEAIAEGKAALAELRTLKVAVLDPNATLGSLRDLVTRSSRNGTP